MRSVTQLKLKSKNIGDAQCAMLGMAIVVKGALAKLVSLDLSNNQIGDPGVASLAEACARGALENLSAPFHMREL